MLATVEEHMLATVLARARALGAASTGAAAAIYRRRRDHRRAALCRPAGRRASS